MTLLLHALSMSKLFGNSVGWVETRYVKLGFIPQPNLPNLNHITDYLTGSKPKKDTNEIPQSKCKGRNLFFYGSYI